MIKLRAGERTDVGRLRTENEDSVWAQVLDQPGYAPIGLFIVCDGMGGHMGGKYASYWAVEAIKSEFRALLEAGDPRATLVLRSEDLKAIRAGTYQTPQPIETDLEKLTLSAIQKANEVVFNYAKHKPRQAANAGTTAAVAVVRGEKAVVANVGDSRSYLLRNRKLAQISSDHSLVATLAAEGKISPEEIFTHPHRNIIYRFLGNKKAVEVDIFHLKLQAGDQLLLCSDGLWETVQSDEKKIELILKSPSTQAACDALVEAANEAGGEDNISAVLVKIS